MIEDRIIAAQRELEAVLALGRTVASARVATCPREQRGDVAGEAGHVIVDAGGDFGGDFHAPARQLADHASLAASQRRETSLRRNLPDRAFDLPLDHPRGIGPGAAGQYGRTEQLHVIGRFLDADR